MPNDPPCRTMGCGRPGGTATTWRKTDSSVLGDQERVCVKKGEACDKWEGACVMRSPTPIRNITVLVVLGWIVTFPLSTAGASQAGKRLSGPAVTLRATFEDPHATKNASFGSAVAKSGTGIGSTILVGAPSTGAGAGAAYIYVKGSSGWPTKPTVTLTDPRATTGDLFGYSVAVSGNTAVVADGSENNVATYLYVRGSSGWPTIQTATLASPGDSVAVSGDTVVVGNAVFLAGEGAAYIYVKGSSGWRTRPTVTLTNPNPAGSFANSVAVSGNTIAVGGFFTFDYIYVKGSSGWPTTPTVTVGSPGNSVAVSGDTVVVGADGAAYLYVKGPAGWPTTPTATVSDPPAKSSDLFGSSVAVAGGAVVVGAPGTNSSAGAAYAFS